MNDSDLIEPVVAPSRRAADGPSSGLESSISFGLRLIGAVESFALQFSFDDLGVIDLPPSAGSAADQANLRSIAPLYLAAELESACVIPAVEVIAGLFASGGISIDLGPAAQPLADFWRNRRDRLSHEERRGIFARLFGFGSAPVVESEHGSNLSFEGSMINLVEALIELDPPRSRSFPSPSRADVLIRTAALALADNLLPRAMGAASFAARDLLETLQLALTLLKQPSIQRAVGAPSLWMAVRYASQRYLNTDPDITSHVARGRSGLLIISWLADVLPRLDSIGSHLAQPSDPVVSSAHEWVEASLSLAEARERNAGA